MKIAELRGEQSRVNVGGEIISKEEPRSVNLRAGGQSTVSSLTLRDDSGSIKLSLWGEQINSVNVGDKIEVQNGYTKAFRGEISLNIGRFGKIKKA